MMRNRERKRLAVRKRFGVGRRSRDCKRRGARRLLDIIELGLLERRLLPLSVLEQRLLSLMLIELVVLKDTLLMRLLSLSVLLGG